MRAKTSLVTLLLVASLLIAPASIAAPSAHAGFGWFSQVKAFVADVFDFFSFDELSIAPDPAPLKPLVSNVCEGGTYPDPSGCPG